VLPRVKAAHVIAIVAEIMKDYLFLREKLQKLFVYVHFSKDHNLAGIFYRDESPAALGIKVQSVIFPFQFSTGKYVKRLFQRLTPFPLLL
jgi:hypothetical protein